MKYSAYVATQNEMAERMAQSKSREAFLAAEKPLIEAALTETRERGFWKTTEYTVPPDPAKVEAKLKEASAQVDRVERSLKELDTALATIPAKYTRGLDFSTKVFDNPALQSGEARSALFGKIEALMESYRAQPTGRIRRMEAVLQTRLTQKLDEERAKTEAHDQTAPVAELAAEAQKIIDAMAEHANDSQRTTQIVRSDGTSVSVTRTRRRPASISTGETTSESEQIINGDEYVLRVAGSTFPKDASSREVYTTAEPTVLPIVARLILDRAVRVYEIRAALRDRGATDEAERLSSWIRGARFVVLRGGREYSNHGESGWREDATVNVASIKKDLSKLGGKSYFERTRATELGDRVDESIVSDIK